jgi:hypothetical protein
LDQYGCCAIWSKIQVSSYFQYFKPVFEFDLLLLCTELMELVGLLQSTKFRIKYDEYHETPAGHFIGYLQYGVVGEVVVCSCVRDFNSAATEASF